MSEGISFLEYCEANGKTELLSEWFAEKNEYLSPGSVLFGSHKKVWWKCAYGHEWQAGVKSRVEGCLCPVCQNRRIVPGINDFASKYPLLALQWHPSKNHPITPKDVFPGSIKCYWWKCEKGHEWKAGIASRTNGEGCPYCAGKKVCPGFNDLQTIFPNVASQWDADKNKPMTPRDVTAFSNKKVWWKCEKGHSWQAIIASRTSSSYQCPYCSGKKVLAGFNDLKTLNPTLSGEWHPTLNGNLKPDMVTCGSHKKVWWRCSEGHEWRAVVFSRAGTQHTGCPYCARVKKETETLNVYLAHENGQGSEILRNEFDVQKSII